MRGFSELSEEPLPIQQQERVGFWHKTSLTRRLSSQAKSAMIQQSVADPHDSVSRPKSASPRDRDRIRSWNDNMAKEAEHCMHILIDLMAVEQPDRPAVCAWDGKLTYRELQQYASSLAFYLNDKFALQSDEVVLLHFEKSMWAVVAAYAVLKAGAAYGFLGLTEPSARVNAIVAQTRTRAVLTSDLAKTRSASLELDIVTVGQDLLQQIRQTPGCYSRDVDIRSLAYVLFTSGSTGVPKTVMIEHLAGATSALEHGRVECVTSRSRVFQFAAFTFDVSTSEIFTTLIMGGCICMPSEDDRLNDVAGSMNDLRVNHAFLTPTVARLVEPEEVPDLKILNLGGEMLDRDNLMSWAAKVKLGNSYGPCEASIRSCFRAKLGEHDDPSNCGHAVGCALWICDPDNVNRLTSVGATGELCIEGPILARGYMGDPKRTDDAFVRPQWLQELFPERNYRIYRTGDLAQYAEDGTVRILGRRDQQIKLHGQRVELTEIESRINALLDTGLSAAIFPSKGAYAGKLVAIVGDSPKTRSMDGLCLASPSAVYEAGLDSLEQELKHFLPSHMLPSFWIFLAHLPVNASFKIDRKRLSHWVESLATILHIN